MLALHERLVSAGDDEALAAYAALLEHLKPFARERTAVLHQILVGVAPGEVPIGSALPPAEARAALAQVRREAAASLRASFAPLVERHRKEMGAADLEPTLRAGILEVRSPSASPEPDPAEVLVEFLERLRELLGQTGAYPLFDEGVADMVRRFAEQGWLRAEPGARARGRQAGAASALLGRLPTCPQASVDEVVAIRAELSAPLVRFRKAVAEGSSGFGDPWDPAFLDGVQEW